MDIDFLLYRFSSQSESSIGAVFRMSPAAEKEFRCFSLEDQHQEIKIPKETRIPAGLYEIKKRFNSPKFKHYDEEHLPWHRGMLHLQDVPGFTWVYIHPLSNDNQTEGCIGVADQVVSNIPEVGRGKLINSFPAYERLYKEIDAEMERGNRVFFDVRDFA